MSIGFSASDIALVVQHARLMYKKYRGSPGDFSRLSDNIGALQAILEQAHDAFENCSLREEQKRGLQLFTSRSKDLLVDLEKFLKRYQSLAIPSSRRWQERVRWSPDEAEVLRGRIITPVIMLTASHTFVVR